MVNNLVDLILSKVKAASVSLGGNAIMKVGPMKFVITAYDLEGIGRMSVMQGSAMFGLMKMDTIMITPAEKDAPLISYDRIFAMGNDTLIIEMYNTCINGTDYPSLSEIKQKYTSIPERDPGEHWYDNIKCSESISKKGKKMSDKISALAEEYLTEYVHILYSSPVVDRAQKQQKNSEYVEGLLNNGGPSTDQFVKAIGKDATAELFRKYLFGTDK